MSLHRLTSIIIGVPDVAAAAAYYRDFGLAELGANRFATVDGGEQLAIAHARQRRLLQLGIGVHDTDDLDRIGSRLDKLGIGHTRNDTSMSVLDPNSSLTVVVEVATTLPFFLSVSSIEWSFMTLIAMLSKYGCPLTGWSIPSAFTS